MDPAYILLTTAEEFVMVDYIKSCKSNELMEIGRKTEFAGFLAQAYMTPELAVQIDPADIYAVMQMIFTISKGLDKDKPMLTFSYPKMEGNSLKEIRIVAGLVHDDRVKIVIAEKEDEA